MVLEIPSLVVTQSTVAYIGPLYGKVVGVAIYSIHTLYSKYPYFWSKLTTWQRYVLWLYAFVWIILKGNKLWKGEICVFVRQLSSFFLSLPSTTILWPKSERKKKNYVLLWITHKWSNVLHDLCVNWEKKLQLHSSRCQQYNCSGLNVDTSNQKPMEECAGRNDAFYIWLMPIGWKITLLWEIHSFAF